MISYETRQDGDALFATFTVGIISHEIPIRTGQTEEEIQATIQQGLDIYSLITSARGG